MGMGCCYNFALHKSEWIRCNIICIAYENFIPCNSFFLLFVIENYALMQECKCVCRWFVFTPNICALLKLICST